MISSLFLLRYLSHFFFRFYLAKVNLLLRGAAAGRAPTIFQNDRFCPNTIFWNLPNFFFWFFVESHIDRAPITLILFFLI